MTLYHYTCRDSLPGIESDGFLRPSTLPFQVVWMTDMETPNRAALGLTSHSLNCDRTEFRLTVEDTESVLPWVRWCRTSGVTRVMRDLIELSPGAQPLRWWVSPDRVPVDAFALPSSASASLRVERRV